ncbi:putative glutathione S-transferase Ure2-like protein [Parathielavia appendiculata]|uniref:Glutathione S-transferase Ure2-like protein n=1 Tax=Parathielavia appendiculata TaxID=2587402 RepID=A0AAN6TNY9_9PEZI|nr:putative glutathione S-transferase Ure2-like protein [Parathielavia appendiculata]
MSSFANLKPIKVWGKGGPNPPKVAILLEELGLPYEAIPVPLSDVKKPDYTAINPNGRLPSIYDPNTDLTLWESGAIIEYLIEKYDPEHKLSFPAGTPESYHAKQYLFFQVSGQGPYYGQAAWFQAFHQEKLPSAIERYVGEVNRVTGVLEGILKKKAEEAGGSGADGPWLVGNKYSFADLVFVSWQTIITKLISTEQYNPEDYPHVKGWIDRILARPPVQAGLGQGGKLT